MAAVKYLLGQRGIPVRRLERLLADKWYLPVGSRTECRALPSSTPWLLPAGPDRKRTLPPLGRFFRIQFAQFLPSVVKSAPTQTL